MKKERVEKSSSDMAALAARVLRTGNYTHDEVLSLAASVLTQAPDKEAADDAD